RAPFTQSLIVLRPVSYLLFCLTHTTTALTIIKGQIARLEKGSTDLGNNADWYIKNAGDLEKENKVEYGSYYPLARETGERLALALLNNRVSQKQIIDYMCMGAKLTATTLIQAAGLKNDDEPITTN
ncbi:hypothetical protein QTN94_17760, partial [Vibrio sp. M250220]|uniref:hypothetical protein n=1 Tax=Vibrio sp. M250220 TaxID=3020894 RepID=UPI002F4002A1